MIVQYSGYNKLITDDICIAMCYFNPLGYYKPLRNIQIIQTEFDKYHIPYYIVELVYPNQYPAIKNSYVVRSSSVLFSKENLWNITEKIIPKNFSKIIFMDADVLCSDPEWLNKTSNLLETHDLIHNMDYSYKDIDFIHEKADIDLKTTKYSIVKAFKHNETIDLLLHHTGFVIAINRDFFHQINGIFEYGITGYGDTLFWAAFFENYEPYCDNFLKMPRFNMIRKEWHKYKKNALSVSSMDRITYLPNAHMLHLKHGTKDNRKYSKRNLYVQGIFDLFHNEDNVLEITIKNKNSKDLLQYWIDRKEDE